jgi:choline dehydrogenase
LRECRARREVIISCGAINSPQLLELSGIGAPEILARNGIEVRSALSGVGENLRDHYGPTLKWELVDPKLSLSRRGRGWRLGIELVQYLAFGRGLMAQGIGTMRVFAKSQPGVEDADIQMIANPFLVDVHEGRRSMSPIPGFFISTQNQRPESSGSVHIKTADSGLPPAISYNFLDTETDGRVAIAGFRLARAIVAASPLADRIVREIAPGPSVNSDDEIVSFIDATGATTYHPVGTCKMGTDPASVVDHRLRVHGVEGLRVADASIMPTIVSGNTSIPCMMIGEKAASMILEDAAL